MMTHRFHQMQWSLFMTNTTRCQRMTKELPTNLKWSNNQENEEICQKKHFQLHTTTGSAVCDYIYLSTFTFHVNCTPIMFTFFSTPLWINVCLKISLLAKVKIAIDVHNTCNMHTSSLSSITNILPITNYIHFFCNIVVLWCPTLW